MNTFSNPAPSIEATQQLQLQSLRLGQAVTAMRAVSDLASALNARKGPGSHDAKDVDIDGLAGLFATLATAVELPLRELDGVIGKLENGAQVA